MAIGGAVWVAAGVKDLSGLIVASEEFPLLMALCVGDPCFPNSWIRWQALLQEADHLAKGAGKCFNKVELSVSTFKLWCHTVGIVPGVEALRAYAIVQRLKADEILDQLEIPNLDAKSQADLFVNASSASEELPASGHCAS